MTTTKENTGAASGLSAAAGYAPTAGDRFEKGEYEFKCPLTGETRKSKGHICVVKHVDEQMVNYEIDGNEDMLDIADFVRLASKTVENGATFFPHIEPGRHGVSR